MGVFRRAGLALLAVFWSLVATAVETQPVELCRRGGCENLSNRQFDAKAPCWDRWQVCACGDLGFTEDALTSGGDHQRVLGHLAVTHFIEAEKKEGASCGNKNAIRKTLPGDLAKKESTVALNYKP